MSEDVIDVRTFYLPWRQEWRVFTTQKHIYPNGVWLEIDNIADLTGKPKAILAFFEDWQKVQWFCWNDGLIGWFCAITKDNQRLDTIVRKATGAQCWREDETYRYYFKHTVEMPDVMTFKEFHRRAAQPEEVVCPS
jgi:hypothetical protein